MNTDQISALAAAVVAIIETGRAADAIAQRIRKKRKKRDKR